MNSEPVNLSLNHFFSEKRNDDPSYNLPMGSSPIQPFGSSAFNSLNCQAWNWSLGPPSHTQHCNWTRSSPATDFDYVYRTAGMVSGKHPYVIVADDLRKN